MKETMDETVTEALEWIDGDMPYSTLFGDHFYARNDGRCEVDHVFLNGNGMPERWDGVDHFVIAELGFGTGLNFLETWRQWRHVRGPGCTLDFVSFEAYPMAGEAIAQSIGRWSELTEVCGALLGQWRTLSNVPQCWMMDAQTRLSVIVGDARATLPCWHGSADAWYLDGFAPSRNPQLWEADLLNSVYEHTRPDGTFATYTAAGWVRRNLSAAGFDVKKHPGYGGKREMLAGIRPNCQG